MEFLVCASAMKKKKKKKGGEKKQTIPSSKGGTARLPGIRCAYLSVQNASIRANVPRCEERDPTAIP